MRTQNKNRIVAAAFAVAVTLMMVSGGMAAAIMMNSNSNEYVEYDDTYLTDEEIDAIISAIYRLGYADEAVLGGLLEDIQNTIRGGLVGIGRAVKDYALFMAVTFASLFLNASGTGGGSTADVEELREELRRLLAVNYAQTFDNAFKMYEKLVLNDANILRLTQAYWNMQIDVAVNVLYKPNSLITDIDRILETSGFQKNMSIIKSNMNTAINELSYVGREAIWVSAATETFGNRIASGWIVGNYQTFGNSTNTYMQVGDYVQASASSYRVWIDVISEPAILAGLPNANAVYNLGTTTKVIENAITGEKYTLQPGFNNIGTTAGGVSGLNIKAGWYDLAPGEYIGMNFIPSISPVGLTPTSGFVLFTNATTIYGYSISTDPNNPLYRVSAGGTIHDVQSVEYAVMWQNAAGVNKIERADIIPAVEAYRGILSSFSDIMRTCRDQALVTWGVLDALEAQTGSYVIRPSSILSGLNPENNLGVESKILLYLAMMKELVRQGENADPSKMMISKDSLTSQILCFGDIYYQGLLIASNAVFTPVYTGGSEVELYVGRNKGTTQGSLLALIYAVDVTSPIGWQPDPQHFGVIELTGTDTVFDINEIRVNGARQMSVTLTVYEAQRIGLMNFGFSTQVPKGVTASDLELWRGLAILFAGLSIVLGGMLLKGNALLIIVGGILMLLGVLEITTGFVGTIIDGITYFFSFDWLPWPFRWW